MPKLNARGDIAAGIGGGVVSAWLTEWDAPRVVIPYQAGGAEWVDEDRILAQHCDGVCRLKTWDRRTGALVTVAEHGASHLSAGGGEWASWLGSLPGIADSLGRRFPTSGLGPMGPDGALAIKVEYQSAGPWDVVERNGSRWRLTDGDAGNITLLGQGRAVWSEFGGVIAARGVQKPLVLGMPFWWLKVVEMAGSWWTLYQEARGLLLHDDRGRGAVIATGNTFRPDVVQLPNGRVRIVWSRGAAEHPDEIEFVDRDLASLRVDLRVTPPPPPPPPPPKDDPMSVPDEEAFVRATVEAHPALLTRLQASSHATDALRQERGNDDPGVLAGEVATNDIKGKLCRVIVYALSRRNANWGLLRKDSGAHAVRADGVKHATDIAFWKPDGKVVDILSDYGPSWANRDGDVQPIDRWVAPLPEPDGDVPPVEDPDDPPATGRTLEDLWTFVVKLEQFHNGRLDRIDTRSGLLAGRVTVLEQRTGGGGNGTLVITGVTLHVDPGP